MRRGGVAARGHADVLRESIDGRGGRDHEELGDDAWWTAYVSRIQAAADTHRTNRDEEAQP